MKTGRAIVRIAAAAGALLSALTPTAARAEVPKQCDDQHEVDKYQLLRRLSLDLRGRIPAYEEYEALDAEPGVPDSLVDEWLKGDEFRLAMRKYHEDMFWPNISNVRLNNTNAALITTRGVGAMISSQSRNQRLRGNANATCGDFEQTHFDPAFPGEFRPDPAYIQTAEDGTKQEGWRWVTPYWAPETPMKVCAFDAQETPSVIISGQPVSCGHYTSNSRNECGCGPGLRWCYAPSNGSSRPILNALREQLGRAVDDVTTGGRPYTDLVLSTSAWRNGTIAFWRRHLAANLSLSTTWNMADPDEPLPADPDFNDDTWERVDRGGLHAGVLTLPAYLLRFQTERGRANRFRINFMCMYFVPPENLNDAPPACSATSNDLTQRCNCRGCHMELEPLAAHWGNFAEAGSSQITDRTQFPLKRTNCVGSSNSFCTRFFVTERDADNPGALQAYQYADEEHPEILPALEAGPRRIAQRAIDDGVFAQCTVKRAFFHLMRREMRVAGIKADELPLLNRLTAGFRDSGYSFPWLVKELVSLPQYRRVR